MNIKWNASLVWRVIYVVYTIAICTINFETKRFLRRVVWICVGFTLFNSCISLSTLKIITNYVFFGTGWSRKLINTRRSVLKSYIVRNKNTTFPRSSFPCPKLCQRLQSSLSSYPFVWLYHYHYRRGMFVCTWWSSLCW